MDDQQLVAILKALANGKRFRMIQELAGAGELSCGEIAEKFDVSQPTVSHHLKILVSAGLLLTRQDGQHHIIAVNHGLLDEVVRLLPMRLRRLPKYASSSNGRAALRRPEQR